MMTDANADWVERNLQRQRKILEEKQRAKRAPSAGVHSNTLTSVEPRHQSFPRSAPVVHNDSMIGYYGPVSYSNNPDSPDEEPENQIGARNMMSLEEAMDRADLSPCVASGEEDIGMMIDPWQESTLETEVLPSEETPDYDQIKHDLETFVKTPARKNCTFKCEVTRDKRGLDKGMYPTYFLHLETGDEKKKYFLLACRRRKKSKTANYLISTDPTNLDRTSPSFSGKVRANAIGTMFTVYDNGNNPMKEGGINDIREELAAILYEKNVLGFRGPRKMTILLPAMTDDGRRAAIKPQHDKDAIINRYKNRRIDGMVQLHNKSPTWNEDSQSYVLNFQGRVNQASVKNFQIIHEKDPDYIIMQFGRVDDDKFHMDFRYPLCPLQAFGIVMSSFHSKLACE